MPIHVSQATTSHPSAPALVTACQLDLALDHPHLQALPPSQRRSLITSLARLMLEARGIVSAAMREDGDEHA
jgi:hypothetical protein